MKPEDAKMNDRSDLVKDDHHSKTYQMKITELYGIIDGLTNELKELETNDIEHSASKTTCP